eukprot:m.329431 g.329431  ORF g.329431 m.329431 type:complete len:136 (+) comp55602_c0_seq27:551-958(+)
MLAAKEGHTELAKMLLERGANMAICDKFGQSAAQLARAAGHGEVLALLEAHKRLRAQQNIKPAARNSHSPPPPPAQAEQDLDLPNLSHLFLEGEPVPYEDPPQDLSQSSVADETQPFPHQEASSPTTVPAMPLTH